MPREAFYPAIPPHLVRCVKGAAKAGGDTDEMVLNELLSADERKACSLAIIEWYGALRTQRRSGRDDG